MVEDIAQEGGWEVDMFVEWGVIEILLTGATLSPHLWI
jgi:hypothetical protein